ncbi:Cardiolipin synthase [Paramicrosporidium saccamoebae]|uniref:Cardiolipin synthase n=1 Tax=Paramicrosporidium saccamoebae TaxID=1246581 RepID=A0A2H9TIL5_9FUNG|nr:Cardiolipin synthase [Paramicrosporidium saccamoebae]
MNTKYSRQELQRIWTIPNALSVGRVLITPVIGHAVLADKPVLAFSLLFASALSDFADGYLARRWRQQSALGSLLDPLGDKVLVGVLAASLAWKGLLPGWLMATILLRDVGLIISGIYVRWRTLPGPFTIRKYFDPTIATATVSPTLISKVNTALQILLLGCTLATPLLVDSYPSFISHCLVPLQWTVMGTTVGSALSYIKDYRKVVKFIKK